MKNNHRSIIIILHNILIIIYKHNCYHVLALPLLLPSATEHSWVSQSCQSLWSPTLVASPETNIPYRLPRFLLFKIRTLFQPIFSPFQPTPTAPLQPLLNRTTNVQSTCWELTPLFTPEKIVKSIRRGKNVRIVSKCSITVRETFVTSPRPAIISETKKHDFA